jgi:hypothetical protein
MQFSPRIKNLGRLKCSKKSSFLSNHVVVTSSDRRGVVVDGGMTTWIDDRGDRGGGNGSGAN